MQPMMINVFAVVVSSSNNAQVSDMIAVNKFKANLLNAVILGLIVLFVKLFKYLVISALYGPLNAYCTRYNRNIKIKDDFDNSSFPINPIKIQDVVTGIVKKPNTLFLKAL